MPKTLSFNEAVIDAKNHCDDSLTVLLGNGFSIAYNATIFSYESLYEEAALANLSIPKADLFATLRSHDFENVMDKLRATADLIDLYGGDSSTSATYRADADVVRNGLADVIAARHPETSSDLTDAEVSMSKAFLSHFRRIYTLSYDLLLYWSVMRREVTPHAPMRDGFEYPAWNDRSTLIWKPRPTQGSQEIYYLHGALHYFAELIDGFERKRLVKLHGFMQRIVDTLRVRLNANQYPLIVTEGTSVEKVAHIERSAYLRTALRRFGESKGAVFIHGASLGANDDHVWETLESESSNVTGLYVGIVGSQASNPTRELIERAKLIRDRRESSGGRKLRLRFYDAESAHVWR
jgi:hypothetical protein